MRFAILENNKVVNTVEAEEDFAATNGWIAAEYANIGDMWDGENFSPTPVIEPVPKAVTMRQARIALLEAGLLDDVDAAILTIPDPTEQKRAKIEWEYSQEVQRHNGFVSVLAPLLGLTEVQTDELFKTASKK